MDKSAWVVTPKAVAALVQGWQNMPGPDGPDFDPHGPLGPIAHAVYGRLTDRDNAVALNPQPLPPHELARMVAQQFVSEMVQLKNLAGALPGDGGAAVGKQITARIQAFDDYCGTGAFAQFLADLLRKIGPHGGGGEHPPRPNERFGAIARLAVGAELHAAAGLVEGLGAAGEKLMQQGLKQLG